MQPLDCAWLAGFLEGEGSFTCVRVSAGCLTLQITFQSTDEDVARKAATLMGANIGGPYFRDAKKPYWNVGISGGRALAIMEAIQPLMGARRTEQILHAVSMWQNRRAVNREAGGPPTCHPDKKHYSRGLCRPCHFKLFVHDLRKGVGEIPPQRPELYETALAVLSQKEIAA